ncbi:MAG: TetR/AcrR family transcriptional regulator [Lautropia sp.]
MSSESPVRQSALPASRIRLLDAAQNVFRTRGYAATTVDDICREAGLSKGSFFHHFESKEALAVEAAAHWNAWTATLFADAPYHAASDPLDRVMGYIAFRASLLDGTVPQVTCLLGTLVQETYASHPAIRAACDAALSAHIATLTKDIAAAKRRHVPRASWRAESVGCFIQAVLQGSFVFVKAKEDIAIARQNLMHLRRYLEMLFHPRPTSTRTSA